MPGSDRPATICEGQRSCQLHCHSRRLSLSGTSATACQAARLATTEISLHTLRHTFASRQVMSVADLRTIQILGGWHDLSLVERYSHLSPGHCQQAIERIVEKFPAKLPPTPETGAVVQLAERRVSM